MSYSRKKWIKAIVIIVCIFVAVAVTLSVSTYFALSDSSKYGMIALFLIGFFFYPLNEKLACCVDSKIGPIIARKKEEARRAKMGFDGEDVVNDWLEEIVGKENIVRNASFLGKYGNEFDIDFIVVSSKGVVLIEVKNFSDPVYFEDDEYFQEKDNRRILLSPEDDPREEARRHAFVLREFLDAHGFEDIKITKMIAFANGLVSWEGKSGIYIIKDKEYLQCYMDGLKDDLDCTPEVCGQIRSLLEKNHV